MLDNLTVLDSTVCKKRKLVAMLELETYGTEEQQYASYEKLKSEIALQGFNVTLSDEILVEVDNV